jgi:hypothetical protein
VTEGGRILALLVEARRRVVPVARREEEGAPYPVLGMEDVLAAVWPALDAAGIVVVPHAADVHSEAVTVKRWNKKTSAVEERSARLTRIDAEYRFVAPDGSFVAARVSGEACDEGDSSVAMAQTAALKVALLQVLTVRTTTPARGRSRGGQQAAGTGGGSVPRAAAPADPAASAAYAAGAAAAAADARKLLWAHVLDLVHGDVHLAGQWLCQVTSWKDRPGHDKIEELSDKAALYLYANRVKAFSADALAKFEAQRAAM